MSWQCLAWPQPAVAPGRMLGSHLDLQPDDSLFTFPKKLIKRQKGVSKTMFSTEHNQLKRVGL